MSEYGKMPIREDTSVLGENPIKIGIIMKDTATKKKFWYFTTTFFCPVCLKEEVHRVRMYTEKPKNPELRYELIENYDHCDDY